VKSHGNSPRSGWTNHRGQADTTSVDLPGFDPIEVLDTLDVPIVIVHRDFTIACFNRQAAETLLRIAPYFQSDRQLSGTVLTFTNVTAPFVQVSMKQSMSVNMPRQSSMPGPIHLRYSIRSCAYKPPTAPSMRCSESLAKSYRAFHSTR
jgi:hypothetical protein